MLHLCYYESSNYLEQKLSTSIHERNYIFITYIGVSRFGIHGLFIVFNQFFQKFEKRGDLILNIKDRYEKRSTFWLSKLQPAAP